jgi:UDP-N-acetylmuramoylalanine--D-glutamate ligase
MSGRIVVIGAGESGTGAAILAAAKGFDVFVTDIGSIKNEYKSDLESHNIKWEEKTHTKKLIENASEVIKSPGIPDDTELIQSLRKKNIPVISEIEFAGRYTDAFNICITGTNGKTTTTMLTYHILKKSGLNVGLGGNVGKSFARNVAEANYDYYVLELSSFQLDGMHDFCADISILLNITEDHLDRYAFDMDAYVDSKFRIASNQDESKSFIYCADDGNIIKAMQRKEINATKIPFSIKEKMDFGAWLNNNEIKINLFDNSFNMNIFDLALQGKHNIYNSMAAAIAANVLNLRKDVIRESLSDFQNVEHRLEFVGMVHGIEFINDSKATNVNSTWYALECMTKPVVLILGGKDKGNDYAMLKELVRDKVKAIVCLGVDNKKIHKAFKDTVEVIKDAASADEAVQTAYSLGQSGDVILLSPACASFDLFINYEDRGRKFKQAVKAL